MTRRESEGIHWTRRGKLGEQFVIKIEIDKARFDALTYETPTPFQYTNGVTYEKYTAEFRKTVDERKELQAYYDSFDYLYSDDVFGLPGFEQYTFKSEVAFELLNESPRSIYRVTPERKLELVERISPKSGS